MQVQTYHPGKGRLSKRRIPALPGHFFENEGIISCSLEEMRRSFLTGAGMLSICVDEAHTPVFFGAGAWQLRSLTDKKIERIVEESEKEGEDDIDQGEFILCRNCKNVVTSTSNKIEMNGKFHHTFTNPRGFIYRIGCFGAALGILNQGAPTMEFTWFAGFSWCYTLCIRCFAHLGWFFQSGEKNFYGLILDHIIEEPRGTGSK